MSLSFQHLYLILCILCFTNAWQFDSGIFDWIWHSKENDRKEIGVDSPLISVPFEAKTEDEKFLEEAIKLKDIIKSSPLDSCQHQIVLKIKNSCSSLTEEELAKLSVNLLNCQSAVDGRQIFPCTDSMSLKQCTEKMDGTMWNAYHMMNNRARAVCILARRAQFQALTEITVNKLMAATHNQIANVNKLLEGQDKLETLTLGTINALEKGNIEIMEQQDIMRANQKGIHDFISHNLHELVREKALIAAGHKELSKLTHTIKEKIDETTSQLTAQSTERKDQHQQLLTDIEALQKLIRNIFDRIDMSTDKLLIQHAEASSKYQEALDNLVKMNKTIHYLLSIIDNTKSEIEEKFIWIEKFLADTGIQINKISCIAYHIAYLLVGMILASFLNFSTVSRIILTLLVPLNLFFTYVERNDLVLGYDQMTAALVGTVLSIAVINTCLKPSQIQQVEYPNMDYSISEHKKKSSRINKKLNFFRDFFSKLMSSISNYMPFGGHWSGAGNYRELERETAYDDTHMNGYVFPDQVEDYNYMSSVDSTNRMNSNSFVRDWLQNNFTTPTAPSTRSSNSQKLCSAKTRVSQKPCRRTCSRGSDYCYMHQEENLK